MAENESTQTPAMFSLRKEDVVTLLVGPDEVEFVVHESCITRNSDFFKAAMKKEWTEGRARTIKLPDENCLDTINHYLNFAYREKLPTEEVKTRTSTQPLAHHYISLARIYVLGEGMLNKSLQRAVVQELVRLTTLQTKDLGCVFPGSEPITIMYEGTSVRSPIRRLMVEFYATHGNDNFPYAGQHPEFSSDLAKSLQEKIIAQKTIRDFRGRALVAENYFE